MTYEFPMSPHEEGADLSGIAEPNRRLSCWFGATLAVLTAFAAIGQRARHEAHLSLHDLTPLRAASTDSPPSPTLTTSPGAQPVTATVERVRVRVAATHVVATFDVVNRGATPFTGFVYATARFTKDDGTTAEVANDGEQKSVKASRWSSKELTFSRPDGFDRAKVSVDVFLRAADGQVSNFPLSLSH